MLNKLINIDKNPVIVNYATTAWGKILIICIYSVFMLNIKLYPETWQQIILVIVVIISFFPRYRHLWLFIGMLCLLSQGLLIKPQPDWQIFKVKYLYLTFKKDYHSYFEPAQIRYINIFLMLCISESIIYFTHRFRRYKIMQYPIAISYLFIFILILIASYASLSYLNVLILWSFITVYNHYFWFIGYTIIERKFLKKRDYLLDYGRYLPIWGFTALPYGKGSIYLRQVESKTQIDFAITQLKALKLAYWAFLLHFLLNFMYYSEAYLKIPTLTVALRDYANGQYYTFYQAWICLLDRFFRTMLELTVTGHLAVATCRICGFRILRNTYKPLQSRTVAEYWNRYNYYFKELLVEFFFFPTYFRFFKTRPRLRIFFATLSAATFGNILFHFLLITPVIINAGFSKGCRGFIPYIFYSCILGVSIGISQLRHLSPVKEPHALKKYLISPFLVLVFYSMLCLFNKTYQDQDIMVNFKFFFSLFNIRW